jgi:hypothetical protein
VKFCVDSPDLLGMGMLDRYKKKNGFIQLLNLIETSGGRKQEQFLGLIAQESPAWEQELKKKILTVERIFNWPNEIMSEVISRIQPLTLCVCLTGRPQAQVDTILAPLPPITKKKILDQMAELNPNAAEKSSCEMKMISEVRAIAASGVIKFEKFDAELFMEENIEERLSNSESGLTFSIKTENSHIDEPRHSDSKDQGTVSQTSGHHQEIDLMKKKLTVLLQENAGLKSEIQLLRDKLNQIKRIA